MKKNQLMCLLLIPISVISIKAQEKRFFMPSEISNAYENGTRSFDGKPGKNYWQNFADYQVKVDVEPKTRLISGTEKVVYKNASPDNINSLVVRLYADVYKKGNSRASAVDARDIDDGVELSDVKINGEKIDIKNFNLARRRGTNLVLKLSKSLSPGTELTFETAWKQKIQYTNIRTGVTDSTTFFIAYFYPQIAVYDDIFGWDKMDYTLQTEFYNNLGNFDFEVSVPGDYLVWSTGTLVNAEKVLPKDIYDKYVKAKSSVEKIQVFTKEDREKGFKTLENTWHFKASEVSDIAFGISNHYLWDVGMQMIDNKTVIVNAAYPDTKSKDCQDLVSIQQNSMKYFSENVPGVPYPYESFTTFIGSERGGMEYPMMANNGYPAREVTVHEMMHTYFPMYVRTNERRWAWMDEGWADYNTSIVENWYFDKNKDFEKVFARSSVGMKQSIGSMGDLPLIVSSEYMQDNYFYASYALPSFVYTIVHQYLGDETFFKCYKEYITRWAKKSPTPYDFFYTFENVSGKDLSWIWKPWFFEFGYPDVAIQSFVKDKLVINCTGNKPVPVFIDLLYENNETKQIVKNAGVWEGGKKTFEIKIADYQKIKRISVNKKIIDYNPVDNYFPSLKEIISKSNISDKIYGDFRAPQFPAIITIRNLQGAVYLTIAEFGIKEVLYPINELSLNTLDDSIKLVFQKDENGNFKNIDIDWEGYKLKAKRVE